MYSILKSYIQSNKDYAVNHGEIKAALDACQTTISPHKGVFQTLSSFMGSGGSDASELSKLIKLIKLIDAMISAEAKYKIDVQTTSASVPKKFNLPPPAPGSRTPSNLVTDGEL